MFRRLDVVLCDCDCNHTNNTGREISMKHGVKGSHTMETGRCPNTGQGTHEKDGRSSGERVLGESGMVN